MSSTWNGDAFFAGVRERISTNVGKAANSLRDSAKKLISIQGPPRSLPGEPPHIDTGRLIASVQAIGPAEQGDVIFATVGTDVFYGRLLEFGTRRVAARPWLVRSLRENQQSLGKIMTTGTTAQTPELVHEGAD
jgi:hypothetical protein